MKHLGPIATALVLVGVPLGVFVVARETAPTGQHLSSLARVEQRFRAQLRREGAKDIRCGRTLAGLGVSCSGEVRGASSTTLYELGAGP